MTRIAITTVRFDEVASCYSSVGLEPVWLPCIRVETAGDEVLIDARKAVSVADLVVISSVRTLQLLWPDHSMPPVQVIAVGELTASAVKARGGRVAVAGHSGLADLIAQSTEWLQTARVVFPHAAGSDRQAIARLRETTSELLEFEVYRAVPVAPDSEEVRAATFASPSAVKGWLLSRDFDGVTVGVIGPTTSKVVAQHRPPDVISSRPSHQALAKAMASHLEVAV